MAKGKQKANGRAVEGDARPRKGKRRADPAVSLAARLEKFSQQLSPEDLGLLQAILVMAMDPLDRQARRVTSVLSAEEARELASLKSETDLA